MTSILFLFSTPPHGSINAQEGLDALLMGSAFARCSAVFTGEGVLQLVNGQEPEAGEGGDHFASFHEAG